MSISLLNADALRIPLADGSVHMIATSPPYWGLRDYGLGQWEGGLADCNHVERIMHTPDATSTLKNDGRKNIGTQPTDGIANTKIYYANHCPKCGATRTNPGLGLEALHDCLGWARGENCGVCFVCRMRLWARECWRVLRDDGTLWLNLGDSYGGGNTSGKRSDASFTKDAPASWGKRNPANLGENLTSTVGNGIKPKDLIGIPWRVALALQADGWWLRSDIIWSKPNPMPESVTDRPTKAHEYVFLLSKAARYFYDADAVREPYPQSTIDRMNYPVAKASGDMNGHFSTKTTDERVMVSGNPNGRNRRTVWDIATAPYPGAHFACFPPALVEPMIKAGTSEAGCCAVCGSQWERVVEKGELVAVQKRGNYDYNPIKEDNSGLVMAVERNKWGHMPGRAYENKTLDFRPTCSHDAPAVPCTVLDTFAGSGTTGQVARQLGRNFIGLDLSFDYLKNEARSRLELDKWAEWTNGKAAVADEDIMALPLFAMGGDSIE